MTERIIDNNNEDIDIFLPEDDLFEGDGLDDLFKDVSLDFENIIPANNVRLEGIEEEDELVPDTDVVDEVLDYVKKEYKKIEVLETALSRYYISSQSRKFISKVAIEAESKKITGNNAKRENDLIYINFLLDDIINRRIDIEGIHHKIQNIDTTITGELKKIILSARSLLASSNEDIRVPSQMTDKLTMDIITELKFMKMNINRLFRNTGENIEQAKSSYEESLKHKRFANSYIKDVDNYSAVYTISYINVVKDPLRQKSMKYYEVIAYRAKLSDKIKDMNLLEYEVEMRYPENIKLYLPIQPENQMQLLTIRNSTLLEFYKSTAIARGVELGQGNESDIMIPLVLKDNDILLVLQDTSIYEEFKEIVYRDYKQMLNTSTTDDFLLTGITASDKTLPTVYFTAEEERDIQVTRYTNSELLMKIKLKKAEEVLSSISSEINEEKDDKIADIMSKYSEAIDLKNKGELGEEEFRDIEAEHARLTDTSIPSVTDVHKINTQLREIFISKMSPFIQVTDKINQDEFVDIIEKNKIEIITDYLNVAIPYIKHQAEFMKAQLEYAESNGKAYKILRSRTIDVITMADLYMKHFSKHKDITSWSKNIDNIKAITMQDILGAETDMSASAFKDPSSSLTTKNGKLFPIFAYALRVLDKMDFGEGVIVNREVSNMDSNFLKEIEPLEIDSNDEFMNKYIEIPKSIVKNILYDKVTRDIDINIVLNSYIKSFVKTYNNMDTFLLNREEIVNDTVNPEDTELIRVLFKNLNIKTIEGTLKEEPALYILKYLSIADTKVDLEELGISNDERQYKLEDLNLESMSVLMNDINDLTRLSICIPYIPKTIKSYLIKNINNLHQYIKGDIYLGTGLPSTEEAETTEFPVIDFMSIPENGGYSFYNVLDTYLKGGYQSAILRDIHALTKVFNTDVISKINSAKDDKSIRRIIEKSFLLNINSNVTLPNFELEDSPVPIEPIKSFVNNVLQSIKPSNIDYTLMLSDLKVKSFTLNKTYMTNLVCNMYKNYHDVNKEEKLERVINLRMLKAWLLLFGPLIPDTFVDKVNDLINKEQTRLRSEFKLIPKMTDTQLDTKKRMSKAAYLQYLKTADASYLSNVDFNYVPASLLTEDSPGFKAKGHWCKENIIRDYNLDSYDEVIEKDLTVADLLQIAERYDPDIYDSLPATLIEEVESVVRVVSKEIVHLLKEDTRFKIKYEVY